MQKVIHGAILFFASLLVAGYIALPAAVLMLGDKNEPISAYEWRLIISWLCFMLVVFAFLIARLYNAKVANSAFLDKLANSVNRLNSDFKQSKPTWDRFLTSFPNMASHLSGLITSLEELKAVVILQIKELRDKKNAEKTPTDADKKTPNP